MSELHFEIAAADEAALRDREYFLEIFDLPGPTDADPHQKYAAVRPAPDAWIALMRTVHVAKQSQENMLAASLKFMDQCLIESDLRKALIQAIEKDPGKYEAYCPELDDDGYPVNGSDEDLSDLGILVTKSNQRLTDRLFDGDDRFGSQTMVAVMESLTQRWSGNPTGSPGNSQSSPSRTGPRSMPSRSPKASTSSGSSTARRRASST